jgi:hypothetical protein
LLNFVIDILPCISCFLTSQHFFYFFNFFHLIYIYVSLISCLTIKIWNEVILLSIPRDDIRTICLLTRSRSFTWLITSRALMRLSLKISIYAVAIIFLLLTWNPHHISCSCEDFFFRPLLF